MSKLIATQQEKEARRGTFFSVIVWHDTKGQLCSDVMSDHLTEELFHRRHVFCTLHLT